MSSVVLNFVITTSVVTGAMGAGYFARKVLGVGERPAERCMWFAMVCGYSSVGLLAIWQVKLTPADMRLPALAAVFAGACVLASLGVGKLLIRDRQELGLFTLAGGFGNAGFTMGGFLCYMFFGDTGLALAAVYCLQSWLVVVVLLYPIARHYSTDGTRSVPLARLVLRSLFDVRSIGFPLMLIAVALNFAGVRMPAVIQDSHFKDIMMFATAVSAFFAVGLRLHVGALRPLLRPLVGLAGVRFVLCPFIGLMLFAAMQHTAWPLSEIAGKVFLVEACLPVGITVVAIANLFGLAPRQASALFVVNTLAYLLVCVPVLAWLLGGR